MQVVVAAEKDPDVKRLSVGNNTDPRTAEPGGGGPLFYPSQIWVDNILQRRAPIPVHRALGGGTILEKWTVLAVPKDEGYINTWNAGGLSRVPFTPPSEDEWLWGWDKTPTVREILVLPEPPEHPIYATISWYVLYVCTCLFLRTGLSALTFTPQMPDN